MIKKAYYSYWHGGYHGQPSEYILDLNKVSIYLARKIFDEIHFITDSISKDYFKDIKFDSITTELDCLDTSYGEVWSLGKIMAYKIAAERGDPFVHIDYDVFFWKKLSQEFLSKSLIAQWVEEYSYDIYEIPKLLANCPNLYLIKDIQPVGAINVGFFGGHDLEFIKNYAEGSLDFVMDPANEYFWKRNDLYKQGWNKAVIAEQYYLEVSRIFYNKTIDVLFKKEWPKEPEALEFGYSHLMGAKYKRGLRDKIHNLAIKITNKQQEEEIEKLNNESEKIIKIFGLPKSGTNLLELLLSINLKNYVCQFADHPNMHYLGWKHGLPQDMDTYNLLQKQTKQKIYFIFAIREFESWKESIINRHFNSHEFPSRFGSLEKEVFYNTPLGPVYYNNLEHLYNTYNNKYIEFAEKYKDRCLIINFEDLQKDQTAIVNLVKDKFNFELTNSSVCEIKKHLDSAGNINHLR